MTGGLTGPTIAIGIVIAIVVGAFLYQIGRQIYFWIAPKIYKWTPQETEKRQLASTGLYLDVRDASRAYRRKRSIRGLLFAAIGVGALFVPLQYEFGRTDMLIWYVGLLIAYLYYQTEIRLKTMQLRLASMNDLLERIAGTADEKNQDQHRIAELSDY